VACSETLFRHLSREARKIKKAADKIVGVSVEIQTQHTPNINQKLSPLEPACSVLCVAAVGIGIITCRLYIVQHGIWSGGCCGLSRSSHLHGMLSVSLTLSKRHLTALQNKSNTVCSVNCEGTV
jgi:hypothetical protein